jgi:hypothetical protein
MLQQNISFGGLLDALAAVVSSNLRVAFPARVERYDKDKQLVDVQPLLKTPLLDESGSTSAESMPVLTNVPVAFPQAGGAAIIFPIAAGDTVMIHICDRSLDQWLERGGEIDPVDRRTHVLEGAVAYPGVNAKPQALGFAHAQNLVIGRSNIQIHIKPNQQIHLGEENAAEFVALADKTLTELNKIKTYLQGIHTVLTGAPIPEPGNGSPSALQTALSVAVAGGLPSLSAPAATKVKAT